jgi:Zn-dependent M28 family amino/carboxypeptidase
VFQHSGRISANQKLLALLLLLPLLASAVAQDGANSGSVCAGCIRSNLEYLAGPMLHGRGSGTIDEFHAAEFIARKLQSYGLAPAAGDGSYIQTASVITRSGTAPVHTWNVLAKLEGTTEKQQIILISAHLDHLGVKNGKTYPGADDDASGTVAVMELARALANGPRPKRTVIFALWGSEETGLLGARYFLKHPTFELNDIIANLEFEMIARPDPKVQPDQLWLTGWKLSDLGPALAAHGAKLVGDPHPEQNFFTRSDNYALAKRGIVAQTVSSYGLHKDYHQPTDTLDKVDWQHLDSAIGSMVAPISWLANSDFTPKWNKQGKP